VRIQNAVVAGHEGEHPAAKTKHRPTNTGLRLYNTGRRSRILA